MQGGMKSAISADESTKPDDSRTVLCAPECRDTVLTLYVGMAFRLTSLKIMS